MVHIIKISLKILYKEKMDM